MERNNPKATIKMLELLKKRGLTDEQFRHIHHLGASIASLQRCCAAIDTFRSGGKNHELQLMLEEMLASGTKRGA